MHYATWTIRFCNIPAIQSSSEVGDKNTLESLEVTYTAIIRSFMKWRNKIRSQKLN